MAQPRNLKPFYFVLGAIAVVGVGAIWLARGGGAGPAEVGPSPVGLETAFDGYVMGSDTAQVEIIEYADFQCPACAQFTILEAPDVKTRLIETGRARWVFRDFPLPQHDKAPIAHHAAACAGEQDRFWPMHDQLFFNQGRWVNDRRPEGVIERLAQAVGLNMDRFDDCMDSGRYVSRIEATKQAGAQLGVGSTPTFVVGGRMAVGVQSAQQLEALVRAAEARAAP